MNCNIIKDLLPLYVDNVCSKESKKLIEEHLKNCEDCQKVLILLKTNIKTHTVDEEKSIKNFKKKLNIKIIKKATIIILFLIITITPIALYYHHKSWLYHNYLYTYDYNEDMRLFAFVNNKSWNFQLIKPRDIIMGGRIYYKVIKKDNKDLLFLTNKYTLSDQKYGGCPVLELDYKNLNPNNIEVYYTTYDLDKLDNISNEDLEKVINSSYLMYNKNQKTSTITCELNKEKYSYTLTYYEVSKQIINSDNEVGFESLNDYSYEEYIIADKAFDSTINYFEQNNGSCTITDN